MKKREIIQWTSDSSFIANKNCPICGKEKYWTKKKYLISEIKKEWINYYEIDPIGEIKNSGILEKKACCECGTYYYNVRLEDSEQLYEHLQKYNSNYYTENKWEYNYVIPFLMEKKINKLLEVGCGQGFFLEKIQSAFSVVNGTELNRNAIEMCKSKGLRVFNSDLHNLQEKYDAIVSFQVLEHVNNPMELIKEMRNYLEPNGILIISTPNPDGILSEFEGILDIPPHHQLDYTKKTFEYIAKELEMDLVKYAAEPLQYWQYEAYYQAKIFKKFRSKQIMNLSYEMARDRNDGHTHLAIFKKRG